MDQYGSQNQSQSLSVLIDQKWSKIINSEVWTSVGNIRIIQSINSLNPQNYSIIRNNTPKP